MTRRVALTLAASLALAVLSAAAASADTDVVMRQYDAERTGANLRETVLTPNVVASGRFHKLFELPVDEKVEAQPLVIRDVPTSGGRRSLIVAATMNNHVFAFDFTSGANVWTSAQLAAPVPSSPKFDMWGTNTTWGILSTPAIDRRRLELYAVTWGIEATGPVYRLHVIDLRTGAEKPLGSSGAPSIRIQGHVAYIDQHNTHATLAFNAARQKQRPALLLITRRPASNTHRTLFIAFGALGERLDPGGSANNSHGWVFAYDLDEVRRRGGSTAPAIWCSTPRVGDGGIWQAGSGLAADRNGDVYAMTGNGSYDGGTDYSESLVRLHYTRPSPDAPARLAVADWFTAFLDRDRAGDGDHQDRDLGSAGPLVMNDLDAVAGGGKDGILYVAKRGALGHRDRGALLEPPLVASYTPTAGVDPVAQPDVAMPDGKSHHIHGAPVYWRPRGTQGMLYLWGENEMLRAFQFDGTAFRLAAIASAAERASRLMPPDGGMPGGLLSLSANADDPATGIVWGTAPATGDANRGKDSLDGKTVVDAPGKVVAGILRAYDAVHFDTLPDGSRRLHLLWDSGSPADAYGGFAKFTPPTVANGRVIVPTFDNKLVVYGVVPGLSEGRAPAAVHSSDDSNEFEYPFRRQLSVRVQRDTARA